MNTTDVLADALDEAISSASFEGFDKRADDLRLLRTRIAALVEAAREIDRLTLVIESCVRHDGSPSEYSIVLAALKKNTAALKAIGHG